MRFSDLQESTRDAVELHASLRKAGEHELRLEREVVDGRQALEQANGGNKEDLVRIAAAFFPGIEKFLEPPTRQQPSSVSANDPEESSIGRPEEHLSRSLKVKISPVLKTPCMGN